MPLDPGEHFTPGGSEQENSQRVPTAQVSLSGSHSMGAGCSVPTGAAASGPLADVRPPWNVPVVLPVESIHVPETLPAASPVPVKIAVMVPSSAVAPNCIRPLESIVPVMVKAPPSPVPLTAPQLSTVACQVPVSLPLSPHVPWY